MTGAVVPEIPDEDLSDPKENLSQVLQRIGAECHDLATTAEWLQDQLGGLADSGRIQPCRETTMALQELDRISQLLRELSALNDEVSGHVEGLHVSRGRLAAAFRLDSLAARILDGRRHDSPDEEFWG